MALPASLLLAAALDGEAALLHASRLAALGPHPWGSPRVRVAAQYVESQLRAAGLHEVRLQEFEAGGIAGANVIGVLPGLDQEIVLLGAHHDTAPGAPGAYDDGGGVGVLIEAARVLAGTRLRPRTIVFASFDGEEAETTKAGTTLGSRAYLRSLGVRARDIAAVVAVEMCGWKGGTPALQPIPYANPLLPGRYVVTPGWLMQAALDGSAEAGARFSVGDPLLSWLYQPAVRSFRVRLYGDDLSFLEAGHPATFVTDSSFSRYYPHYHEPSDTADKLEAANLERVGRGVVAMVRTLVETRRGSARDIHWFAAFGRVFGRPTLVILGVLSLIVALRAGLKARGLHPVARLAAGAAFLILLWRNPVPAVWVFTLPHLTAGLLPGRLALALSFAPALALVTLGAAAWWRGFVTGVWFAPWELGLAAAAVALLFVRPGAGTRAAPARRKAGSSPRRRGLKERS